MGALEPALSALSDRILKARALREHHVWEAAKAMSFYRPGRPRDRNGLRFAALMDADALVDAVLLMAAASQPKRWLAGIRFDATRWVCTMRDTAGRCFQARHPDLAAALLGALLNSLHDGRDGQS